MDLKQNNINYTPIIYGVVFIVSLILLIYIFKKIGGFFSNGFGLGTSDEEKKEIIKKSRKDFDLIKHKLNIMFPKSTINESKAKVIAEKIYSLLEGFVTDEEMKEAHNVFIQRNKNGDFDKINNNRRLIFLAYGIRNGKNLLEAVRDVNFISPDGTKAQKNFMNDLNALF